MQKNLNTRLRKIEAHKAQKAPPFPYLVLHIADMSLPDPDLPEDRLGYFAETVETLDAGGVKVARLPGESDTAWYERAASLAPCRKWGGVPVLLPYPALIIRTGGQPIRASQQQPEGESQ